MGRRGPAPTPTPILQLRGTHRKDRTAPREPKPAVAAPSCPSWLSREAKREWRRIVPELVKVKVLTRLDRAALAGYCQAYARWRAAEKALGEDDFTFTTEKGYVVPRPEVAIAQKSLQLMKAFADEFGLTPASRSRVNAVPEGEKQDPTKNFLFGPRKHA